MLEGSVQTFTEHHVLHGTSFLHREAITEVFSITHSIHDHGPVKGSIVEAGR
jgi:hypothetical protein